MGCVLRETSILLVTIALLIASDPLARAEEEDSKKPIELRPYRVKFSIAFARSPQLSQSFRESCGTGVADTARRLLGQMWDLTTEENDWLFPRTQTGLNRITTPELASRFKDSTADKIFLFVIEPHGAGLNLCGREWDQSTQSIGPPFQRRTYDRRLVVKEMFAMSQAMFRPITEIEQVDQRKVVVRVKAGEFPTVDPDVPQLKQQDLLQPYMRYLDRQLELQRVQSMPWSYLVVAKTTRGWIQCDFKSGLSNPLGAKSRRRVELMAARLNRITNKTRLRLQPSVGVKKPLFGYTVSIADKHPREIPKPTTTEETASDGNSKKSDDSTSKEDSKAKNDAESKAAPPKAPIEYTRLISDRLGRVEINVDQKHAVVWLYVRSGKNLLAILPFAPGVESEQVMKLPDDTLRLDVEGRLALLEAELIDTVARRALYMAMATSLSKKAKWDQVAATIKQFDELPKVDVFETKLTAIRFPAIEAAESRRDRRGIGKIKSLCNKMLESIRQHLDPQQPKDLKAELAELQRLDEADRRQDAADAKDGK